MKKFPNLTLKKLKFFEAGSEETPCFTADLYDNGKLVAHVRNDGCGGSNYVYAAKGVKPSDIVQYTKMDVDCYIMELAEHGNIAKKYQTKNVVLEKDGEISTFGWDLKTGGKASIAKIKKTNGGITMLNKTRDKYIAEGYNVLNTNF